MELLLGLTGIVGASIALFGISLNKNEQNTLLNRLIATWYYLDDANTYTITRFALQWFQRQMAKLFGHGALNIRALLFFFKWQFWLTLAVFVATLPDQISESIDGIDLKQVYQRRNDLQALLAESNGDQNLQWLLYQIDALIEEMEVLNQSGEAWRSVIDGVVVFWIEAGALLLMAPAIAYVSTGVTRMLIERAVRQTLMRSIVGVVAIDITAGIFFASLVFWVYNGAAVLSFIVYDSMRIAYLPQPREMSLWLGIGAEVLFYGDWVSGRLAAADGVWQYLAIVGSITLEMWSSYVSDIYAFLTLDWLTVTDAEAVRNWGLTLSLLPTAMYLSGMLVTSIGSRADVLRKGVAKCIAWGIERERGTLVALGGAVVGLCAAIRVAFF